MIRGNAVMKIAVKYLSILLLVFVSTTIRAGVISQMPLFASQPTVPNVFFELDDSGSMDWTILSKKYWGPCAYDPDAGDNNNLSTTITSTNACGYITNGNMYSYGSK